MQATLITSSATTSGLPEPHIEATCLMGLSPQDHWWVQVDFLRETEDHE